MRFFELTCNSDCNGESSLTVLVVCVGNNGKMQLFHRRMAVRSLAQIAKGELKARGRWLLSRRRCHLMIMGQDRTDMLLFRDSD